MTSNLPPIEFSGELTGELTGALTNLPALDFKWLQQILVRHETVIMFPFLLLQAWFVTVLMFHYLILCVPTLLNNKLLLREWLTEAVFTLSALKERPHMWREAFVKYSNSRLKQIQLRPSDYLLVHFTLLPMYFSRTCRWASTPDSRVTSHVHQLFVPRDVPLAKRPGPMINWRKSDRTSNCHTCNMHGALWICILYVWLK